MKKEILLLEGEPIIEQGIVRLIEKLYPIRVIDTELGFRQHLCKLEYPGSPPEPLMVISDARLRWAYPSATMVPPPPDVTEGNRNEAGFRCWQMFRQYRKMVEVPWLFYTDLNEAEVGFKNCNDPFTFHLKRTASNQSLSLMIDRILLEQQLPH